MEIVCDNSELNAGAEAADVLVIGGYAIARDKVSGLLKKVQDTKSHFGLDPHCPVKWNLRDLDRALTAHGLLGQKDILIGQSNPVRKALLDALTESGATILTSVIHAYSGKKQVLGKTKDDLVSYSFGNLLMRAGLFCKEKAGGRRVDVLLDWPEANNPAPFVSEYHTGWRYGRSGPEGTEVKYECGCLADLAYAPTTSFARTDFDPRLQLADLVVGATREFISFALGKVREDAFGVERFKALLPHLYARNGRTLGAGITVSPTMKPLSTCVLEALKKLASKQRDAATSLKSS